MSHMRNFLQQRRHLCCKVRLQHLDDCASLAYGTQHLAYALLCNLKQTGRISLKVIDLSIFSSFGSVAFTLVLTLLNSAQCRQAFEPKFTQFSPL